VEGLLRDASEERRAIGTRLFTRLELLEPYAKTLREARNWSERAHAAEMLGRAGNPHSVPALVGALRDPYEDANVRRAATDALAKLKDPEAVPLLVAQLQGVDERSSRPIAEALVAFGDQAAPALLALIGDATQTVGRVWAARILGQMGAPSASEVLVGLLLARDDLLRIAAAEALGQIGQRAALQPLVQAALRDPAPQVRAHAAAAVARIEPEGAVDVLIAALADPDYATRLRALEAFEHIPLADTAALERALRDPSPDVRRRAALALERVGYLGKLVEQLAAEDPRQVDAAYERLLELGRAGLADSVASHVNHGHFQVRALAARAAGELGATRSIPVLVAGAADTSWPVRAAIAEALGRLRGEKAAATLATMLADAEEPVAEAAAQALCAFPATDLAPHVDALGPAYDRGTMPIRLAMTTLATRIDLAQTTPLLSRAMADPSEAVRLAAVTGIGARGEDEAMSNLLSCLTDSSLEVRMAAVTAIGARANADAFEGLLRALPGAPTLIRDRIAAALAEKGLEHMLRHASELVAAEELDVRLGVAWTLGRAGDLRGIPYLDRFLHAPEAPLRASAAGALGKIRAPEAVAVLVGGASDPDARTRAAIVNALGRIGGEDPRAIAVLTDRLGDPDRFVRNRAAIGLALLSGPEAERRLQEPATREQLDPSALIVALAVAGTETSVPAALELGLRDGGLEAARRFLQDGDPGVRARFFAALRLPDGGSAALDAGSPELLAQYEKVLRGDLDLANRRVAIEALARLRGPLVTGALADTLISDPAAEVRVRAADALAGRTEARAREALSAAIADPSIDVAVAAIRGLSNAREAAVQKALFARLGAASPRLNEAVVEALARIHEKDIVPFLDRMMGVDRPEAIVAGIRVLTRTTAPASLPLLGQLLRSPHASIRTASIDAIARLPGPEADAAIEEAVTDPSEVVRSAALRAIAKTPGQAMRLWRARLDPSIAVRIELADALATTSGPGSAKLFDALLEDGSSRVRASTLASLLYHGDAESLLRFAEIWPRAALDTRLDLRGHARGPEVTTRLAGVLASHHQGEVRAAAVKGMSALGAPGHAKELLIALGDPDPSVRVASIMALASIDDPAIRARLAELASDPDGDVREAARRASVRSIR
jgi:HEAT repeat protein